MKFMHLFALVALQLPMSLAATAQELPPVEYAIRESVPQTGTTIKKEVAWSSALPINRTYAQLTPEQRAPLHAEYERIEEGDEPPFPRDGLKPLLNAIWKGQSSYLATGTLLLVATVDAAGKVTKVDAYGVPDPDLAKYAASVLLLTEFKPALCKGTPCAMQFPFSLKPEVK